VESTYYNLSKKLICKFLCLAVAEATPEELAKRQLRAKMKEEYLAALSHEGQK